MNLTTCPSCKTEVPILSVCSRCGATLKPFRIGRPWTVGIVLIATGLLAAGSVLFFLPHTTVMPAGPAEEEAAKPPAQRPAKSAGWNEPTSFRGIPFGEDLRSHLPHCKSVNWEKDCRNEPVPVSPTVSERAGLPSDVESFALFFRDPLGSVRPEQTQALQWRRRLVSIQFVFPTKDFPELLAMFKQKYGAPSSLETQPWQSKGGVKLESHTATWTGERLAISLVSLAGKVDEGQVVFAVRDWINQIAAISRQAVQRGAKAL